LSTRIEAFIDIKLFSGAIAGDLRRRSSHVNHAPSKLFSVTVAGEVR
jgi:hypothetical protein